MDGFNILLRENVFMIYWGIYYWYYEVVLIKVIELVFENY